MRLPKLQNSGLLSTNDTCRSTCSEGTNSHVDDDCYTPSQPTFDAIANSLDDDCNQTKGNHYIVIRLMSNDDLNNSNLT